ncbi:hypothetical protein HZB78_06140 [Candidatus Collierbacteria bacterium]|nr:hypothetical protein [Candidatus Collierbacteria bacterium]
MKRNKWLYLWLLLVGIIYLAPWWRSVYFLWDDIEFLILLKFHLWNTLLLSHEYQFFPIFQIFYWIEIQLFGVNPSLFFLVSVVLHIVNIFLASSLTFRLTKSEFSSVLAAILVSFNKSFFEIIFWPTLQSNLLLTTSSLFAVYLFLKSKNQYNNYDALKLFLIILIGNFLFGFGIAVGFIFTFTALIFFNPGKGRSVLSFLTAAASIIGVIAIISFSTAELRQEGKMPELSFRQLSQIVYFTAVGPSEGIISRFFLPGFVPNIYSLPNILIMILIPGILVIFTGFLVYRFFKKKSWKKSLYPLFMFYSLTVAPYAIAALARSANGAYKALADRYVYYPLFFFVLALIYSLFLFQKLLGIKQRLFHILTVGMTIIIVVGHLVAMNFKVNLLFL